MDGGAWWAAVHGIAKSLTRLSDFTFTFHFQTLEKEMATHSSVLAWRIPGRAAVYGVTQSRTQLKRLSSSSSSSHKKEGNLAICKNMDGPQGHYKWNESNHERQILCNSPYMCNLINKTKLIDTETRLEVARDGQGGWAKRVKRVKRYKLLVIK